MKYKGKGTKLIFDDDGEAHALYEFEDEEAFKKAGDAEQQRERYLADETKNLTVADIQDKTLAKEKRKAKREKQKARLQEGDAEDIMDGGDDFEEDDGVHLAPYQEVSIDEETGHEPADTGKGSDERPSKKQKKWFEDDSDEERKKKKKAKRKSKVVEMQEEPETLDDLEALAAGLLA